MQKSIVPNTQAKLLDGWGCSLLNKCTAVRRNRIKREQSKKRRLMMKKEVNDQS